MAWPSFLSTPIAIPLPKRLGAKNLYRHPIRIEFLQCPLVRRTIEYRLIFVPSTPTLKNKNSGDVWKALIIFWNNFRLFLWNNFKLMEQKIDSFRRFFVIGIILIFNICLIVHKLLDECGVKLLITHHISYYSMLKLQHFSGFFNDNVKNKNSEY